MKPNQPTHTAPEIATQLKDLQQLQDRIARELSLVCAYKAWQERSETPAFWRWFNRIDLLAQAGGRYGGDFPQKFVSAPDYPSDLFNYDEARSIVRVHCLFGTLAGVNIRSS
jgi:hypothetical protein